MEKILKARLKMTPEVMVKLGDIDFNRDWISASDAVEGAKRRCIEEIKDQIHSKVAVLSLDDIEFKIV